MSNQAQKDSFGYQCPVRGCDKRKNRRFSLLGICMHIEAKHGIKELEKRLKIRKIHR